MKFAIISDTHDHHENVLKAVRLFNDHKVDYIFHAGDMVAPFTARAFADVNGAKLIAVFGNNEGEKLFLRDTIESFGGEIHDPYYKGEIHGTRIFMTHRPDVIEEVALSGHFDLVIYGHTHKPDIRRIESCLIVNPGECSDWMTGRPQVVLLDVEDGHVEPICLSS